MNILKNFNHTLYKNFLRSYSQMANFNLTSVYLNNIDIPKFEENQNTIEINDTYIELKGRNSKMPKKV